MSEKRQGKGAKLRLAVAEPKEFSCGLCGSSSRLTRTSCCNQLICDDEDEYVLFWYAKNSCFRNHSRQTICAYHHSEGHAGNWKSCDRCRNDLPLEMFGWYATNEFNFEKLENPPPFKPTLCSGCGRRIVLPEGENRKD